MSITKHLNLALYDAVDEDGNDIGMQACVVYAKDEAELLYRLDRLPAERDMYKEYRDVLHLTHGIVLADGAEIPATIVVDVDDTKHIAPIMVEEETD
jgi:hypothetical protein